MNEISDQDQLRQQQGPEILGISIYTLHLHEFYWTLKQFIEAFLL
jgi:hypothetical protein